MKKLYADGKLSDKAPRQQIQRDIKSELFAVLEAARQQITMLNLHNEIRESADPALETQSS